MNCDSTARFLFDSPSPIFAGEKSQRVNIKPELTKQHAILSTSDNVDDNLINVVSSNLQALDHGEYRVDINYELYKIYVNINKDFLNNFFLPKFRAILEVVDDVMACDSVEMATRRLRLMLEKLNLVLYKKASVLLLVRLLRIYPEVLVPLLLSIDCKETPMQELKSLALGYTPRQVRSLLGISFWNRLMDCTSNVFLEDFVALLDLLKNPKNFNYILEFFVNQNSKSDQDLSFARIRDVFLVAEKNFGNIKNFFDFKALVGQHFTHILALVCNLVIFLDQFEKHVPEHWVASIEQIFNSILNFLYHEIFSKNFSEHKQLDKLFNHFTTWYSSISHIPQYKCALEWKFLAKLIAPNTTTKAHKDNESPILDGEQTLDLCAVAFPVFHLTWSQLELLIRSASDWWNHNNILIFLKNLLVNRKLLEMPRVNNNGFIIGWLVNVLKDAENLDLIHVAFQVLSLRVDNTASEIELYGVLPQLLQMSKKSITDYKSVLVNLLIFQIAKRDCDGILVLLVDRILDDMFEFEPGEQLLLLTRLIFMGNTSELLARLADRMLYFLDAFGETHTDEQYLEFLPKKSSFDSDVFLERSFLTHPILLDMLGILVSDPLQISRFRHILRSLLAILIGHVETLRSSKISTLDSLWRALGLPLIHIFSKARFIPTSLTDIACALPLIPIRDAQMILLSMWHHVASEKPSSSHLLATVRLVLRKNIHLVNLNSTSSLYFAVFSAH